MVGQALTVTGIILAGRVIGPGATDFLGLEGIVFGAVAVDHFDIAAALFGPQTMGRGLGCDPAWRAAQQGMI